MNLLRKTFRFLVQADGTPEQLARAFALGVLVGFSPLLGLHTVLGFLLAVGLRLNKIAVLAGVYLNNPWVIVPFYGFSTWLGVQITGLPPGVSLPDFGLTRVLDAEFWRWVASQWRLLIPAVVGSSILSLLFAGLAYPISLWIIRRLKASDRGGLSKDSATG